MRQSTMARPGLAEGVAWRPGTPACRSPAAGRVAWRARVVAWAWRALLGAAALPAAAAPPAAAARGAEPPVVVSPQGWVAEVRQISVRFSADAVAAGDPAAPAPVQLRCRTGEADGDGRWLNPRHWVLDLRQPLPAGRDCTVRLAPGFVPLAGALRGAGPWSFSTGAPRVVALWPEPGSRVSEDQHWLLRFNGPPQLASVQREAACEVEGLGDRIAVQVLSPPPAAGAIAALQRRLGAPAPGQADVLLHCSRPLPAGARVRLVLGPGVAAITAAPPAGGPAAAAPAPASARAQRWQWQVQDRFTAETSCERENAQAPCMPLRALWLRFSAPVPREQALAAQLVPAQGRPIAASAPGSEGESHLQAVRFGAPLPESMRFTLTLPATLVDEQGRALANRGAFPMALSTGRLPPLAKFGSAPFGVVEAPTGQPGDAPALVPLTLRHVQADWEGGPAPSQRGQLSRRHFGPATPDAELLRWIGQLQSDADDEFETRAVSRLAGQGGVQHSPLPTWEGRRGAPGSAPGSAPGAAPAAPPPTEVLGVPVPERGYHVLEARSQLLGQALLAPAAASAPAGARPRAPGGTAAPGPWMHVRTGVLVTALSVHFKRGRSSSLVWVTRLDRARPVAAAQVVVNDCRGRPLWSGSTDAQGLARIPRGFEDEEGATGTQPCLTRDGLFVTARQGEDLAWVFSRWNRGIEPWRFGLPTGGGSEPDLRAHAVLDRSLLRAGELLQMKLFVRQEGESGLSLPQPAALPRELVITHVGSGQETRLPLAWPAGPRSTEARWRAPATAALGTYELSLERPAQGDRPALRLPAGSFRIEAFRVPLLEARLSVPAGDAVGRPELALLAQVQALAGGPSAALPLQLDAVVRPASPSWPGLEDFSFSPPDPAADASPGDADERAAPPGQTVLAAGLRQTTDGQGAARFVLSLPASAPALAGPAEVQAEMSLADPNGEVQTVGQRVRWWPASVVVGLRVPGWTAQRGRVQLTAVVVDTQGQPLAGRDVRVQAQPVRVTSSRQRIVGGFYQYLNRRELEPAVELCRGRTDRQGRLSCDAAVAHRGELQIVAQAQDDQGRTSRSATSAWLWGEDAEWFAQDNDDRVDLLPEQRELQPGQTARLQLRMPYRQATVLLTVEREGVLQAQVLQLSGREPVIELPVPAQGPAAAAWAPNVIVSALVLRGRLREAPWWSIFTWGWKAPGDWWQAWRHEGRDWRAPSGVADLAKPGFKLGVAQLRIGSAAQRLDVRVSADRTQYRVRETAQVQVQVSHAGQPAAGAQVSFAAVDEGLLALAPNRSWELRDGLLQPRPWGVETATAQGEIIGRRHYGRKALPPGGGGGRQATRELFDTLLLWRATVELDAQGRATLQVPLNDSLTRWRLVAIADQPAGTTSPERWGTGSTTVTVHQELQMLSGLAPLVHEGDQFQAGFTVRNTTTRPLQLTATLAGQAVRAGQPAQALALPARDLSLAPGAAQELRWPVQVPPGTSALQWQAEVREAGPAATALVDRLQVRQTVAPVVPVRVQQASLLPLDGVVTVPTAAPAAALPGSATLQVMLQPRLGGDLPGLRRWFEQYPFTCLEQQTSRALALRDAAAWAELGEKLPAQLDADGLALFFPALPGSVARGSDRLTAYLLSAAHEAGRPWPAPLQERMLAGLGAWVEGRIERRFAAPQADGAARRLAALEALARHGRAQPRQLDSLAWTPAVWPTSALLDAWSVLRRLQGVPDQAARLQEVQALIRSRLVAGGTALRFSTEAQDQWSWLMEGPDANAARLVLAALDSPAWQADLPALVTGALARQRRGAWDTTTANLWGVLALERFGSRQERGTVDGITRLASGAAQQAVPWPPGGAAPPAVVLPLADSLQVRHEGAGRPWMTVQALAAVPLTAPVSAGLRLQRSWRVLQARQPGVLSRGDVLRVRLQLQSTADLGWVVVQDPLPAGATVLGTVRAAGPGAAESPSLLVQGEQRSGPGELAYEERTPGAWRAYLATLPRGTQVLEYTVRLNTAGTLQLPPSRAEAMYAPELFAELPNEALQVQP